MSSPLRAAVIGASGIGKHHAKWFNALGCEVVAFAGTSAESVAATTEVLQKLFGFTGKGYVGVEAMLDGARPDLLALCSPPQFHAEHFALAAEAGCAILCEKPLVWDWDKPFAQLLDEAGAMVEAACTRGLLAATNTQYVAALEPYLKLCQLAGQPVDTTSFDRFYMRMDSRGGKSGAGGEKIWVDLSPHPLSLLLALAGPGELEASSARVVVDAHQVRADFTYRAVSGRTVQANIDTVNVPEGPLARRFGLDDVLADYEGRNDENGVFAVYLCLGDHRLKSVDFVQDSISRFVAAVRGEGAPLVTLEEGLANLQLQLQLMQIGRDSQPA